MTSSHYAARTAEDLPFVAFGPGTLLQLVHADVGEGLYVLRCRFEPGVTYPVHRHGGPVHAITMSGRWRYEEFPEVMEAGTYSFDPGGRNLTLHVAEDQEGETEVVFICHGPTENLRPDGTVESVIDAGYLLGEYTKMCTDLGADSAAVIRPL